VSPVVVRLGVEAPAGVLLVVMCTGDTVGAPDSVAPLVPAMPVSLASLNAFGGSACLQASVPVGDISSVEQYVLYSSSGTPTSLLSFEVSDGLSLVRKSSVLFVGLGLTLCEV